MRRMEKKREKKEINKRKRERGRENFLPRGKKYQLRFVMKLVITQEGRMNLEWIHVLSLSFFSFYLSISFISRIFSKRRRKRKEKEERKRNNRIFSK